VGEGRGKPVLLGENTFYKSHEPWGGRREG
jgi:hypothetical protein